MIKLDNFTPYESGVVARWLLGEMIKQGCIEGEGQSAFNISIKMPRWQMEILAEFCKDREETKPVSNIAEKLDVDLKKVL